jgi:hypothetical protein
MVSVKQSQEASLSARSAFHTTEAKIVTGPLEIAQVPKELLDPERRALPDGSELRGLKVREPEGCEVPILRGERRKSRDEDS